MATAPKFLPAARLARTGAAAVADANITSAFKAEKPRTEELDLEVAAATAWPTSRTHARPGHGDTPARPQPTSPDPVPSRHFPPVTPRSPCPSAASPQSVRGGRDLFKRKAKLHCKHESRLVTAIPGQDRRPVQTDPDREVPGQFYRDSDAQAWTRYSDRDGSGWPASDSELSRSVTGNL